jgi:intracellular septation protein
MSGNGHAKHLRRLALDLGPLILFFAAYKLWDFFVATGVFMVAAVAALAISYAMERRISPMPLVSVPMVLVFGGLTLYFKNDAFLKMKPTFYYVFAMVTLIGGLAFNRLFIKYIFEYAFDLTDEGWRGLTWRWGIFFGILAVLNEIVWRNFSTDVWWSFKAFGAIPLTFIFALAQTPFVMKHQIDEAKTEP